MLKVLLEQLLTFVPCLVAVVHEATVKLEAEEVPSIFQVNRMYKGCGLFARGENVKF